MSLPRFVNRVIDTAGTYLPGELTDPEMRERVNILMVAMLSEALPPRARARLEGLLTTSRRIFRSLFTLSGLITLVLLIAAYAMLAGWLDRRAGPAAVAAPAVLAAFGDPGAPYPASTGPPEGQRDGRPDETD